MQLVILGSGTPNPDPERSGPAVAIVINGSAYLVDAGPGVVRRAAAAARRGVDALGADRIQTVFLTHLHSDHTVGLPDLMFSTWVLGRSAPIQIYGPPGTASMVSHLQAAYAEDTEIRLNGGEPSNKTGWEADAHEIRPGVVYQDENVKVTAIPVLHGTWTHAYGYRFEGAGRSIVISGDTRPSRTLEAACAGCDILVHEVYSDAGFRKDQPPPWQAYHKAFHTAASDLGRLATAAHPGLLVLVHQLFWSTPETDLVKEVQSTYAGRVVSSHDLDIY